jgi:hypothetical protein
MLAHSIARVLDRNKQYDVDAANFTARYKLFVFRKLADKVKGWGRPQGLKKKTEQVKTA